MLHRLSLLRCHSSLLSHYLPATPMTVSCKGCTRLSFKMPMSLCVGGALLARTHMLPFAVYRSSPKMNSQQMLLRAGRGWSTHLTQDEMGREEDDLSSVLELTPGLRATHRRHARYHHKQIGCQRDTRHTYRGHGVHTFLYFWMQGECIWSQGEQSRESDLQT